MKADSLYRALDGFGYVAVGRCQRFAGTGELEQRIDEIGHEVHAGPHFLVEFLALRWGETGIAEEFRVGDDSGQGVAKVVGDGTGHASDGGKLSGLEQVALALEETGAHAIEGAGQLGNFGSATGVERMMELSALQATHSGNQAGKSTREGMRDEEDQSAADNDGGEGEQEKIAIQFAKEFGGLIVGPEHAQTDGRDGATR